MKQVMFRILPSIVKVESTQSVEVPSGVDDRAEYSVGGIRQRTKFVVYEVVEGRLRRLHDLQRSNSLRHLRLPYKKEAKSLYQMIAWDWARDLRLTSTASFLCLYEKSITRCRRNRPEGSGCG